MSKQVLTTGLEDYKILSMSNRQVCNTVEAKARLNDLLDQVEDGGEVVIQRRGEAIAKLVPVEGGIVDDKGVVKKMMVRLRRFHSRVREAHGSRSRTVLLLRTLRRES